MTSARDEILARVRSSLVDVPTGLSPAEDSPVDWEYVRPVELPGEMIEVFAERVADYKATVIRCQHAEVPQKIVEGLQSLDATSAVVPMGLDESWQQAVSDAGIEVRIDTPDSQLSHRELNDTSAVITASAVGSAETGTIVLDHADDQGRRALSLVPDIHICVIRTDQVVSSVPECIARLKPSVQNGQPLTWISGPSATSDIELSRVEGVHGPRNLYVIISE